MVTVTCEESQRCMGFPRNADAGSEVFENLEAGMPVDEITTVFDVTHEEVKAILHSASASLAKDPTFG